MLYDLRHSPRGRSSTVLSLCLLFLWMLGANAADSAPLETPSINPQFKRLQMELHTLFKKHYPKVTAHSIRDSFYFEYDTRIFLIHDRYLTGEWQDPQENRGPNAGGIICGITLQKGPYKGQAKTPQTLDKFYYDILVLTPYSSKHDIHLLANLSYPKNPPLVFLKEFTALVNDFEKYLD
ncbi:MAG TPA: hypothetical protein VMZ27_11405 [Candidatus Saccharimonadales bacterium]|nr:hypothetical protein [Candidatus Saccharimonadales bacterium]